MSGISILPHPMGASNAHKWIAWITGILTFLLALFSFILSFNALTDLADSHGVSIPLLFPLIVEFAVVIFSLNALYRSLVGEKTVVQWILIIGASLFASLFNVVHANADLNSRLMAAMPSLFLLLSFETLMGQVRHVVNRSNLVRSLAHLDTELSARQQELDTRRQEFDQLGHKQAQLDEIMVEMQTEVDHLNSEVEKLNIHAEQAKATLAQLEELAQVSTIQLNVSQRDTMPLEQRRARLVDILNTEGDIGVTALADRLNIARGTVYNDLKALTEEGVINRNGRGWEVVQ